MNTPFRVLLVYTGNICRSPTAHGVLEKMVADAGLQDEIYVDSAGTHSYHVGEAPDTRSQLHAHRRISPLAQQQRMKRLTDYCQRFDDQQVPDPYYGGDKGFEHVLDLVEDACQNLLQSTTAQQKS